MLRKGRKGLSSSSAVGGGGGTPSRSATREALNHQPPSTSSPASNRTNLLYQCYDTSLCAPSSGKCLSPSNAGVGSKLRPNGVTGAFAAVAAAGNAKRPRRGVGITCCTETQRHHSAQVIVPNRANKQQQLGSNDTRTPPPSPPVARGDGSYANENTRLVVSDPLPYSARHRQKDGNGGGGVDSHTMARREGAGSERRRGELHGAPDLSGGKGNDSVPYGGTGMGRPRASSLPRTQEDVKEVLPRLRPLREGGHGSELSKMHGPPQRLSAPHHVSASGDALDDSRMMAANGIMSLDDREREKQREVLSAPPASSTIIPSSFSPRPVGDQLRLLGRHSSRVSARVNDGKAPRAAGLTDARALHSSLLSSSGSDDDEVASSGGPFGLETAAAAGGGAASGRTAPMETLCNMKGGAVAAVAAAVTQRGITGLGETASKPLNGRNGASVRRALQRAEVSRTGQSSREMRHEAADADELFSSTQMLFSSKSDAKKGDRNNAGAQPVQPFYPVTAQSSRMRNHPDSGARCAENELPVYKFNVVLSSGKTTAVPISLIAGTGCVQGMRPTMEDAHFVELNATHVRGQPVSLLAVLDGHCGRRVADLGAKWLPHYVLHHAALGENNALALVESILQTDREIFHTLQAKSQIHQRRKAGRGSGRRRRDLEEEIFDEMTSGTNGGSTLIAAAVCGRMLYVACLGDARAVLYDGHTTIAMSEDHKPCNTDESRRIAKCGGFVQFGRVCGILAVSRALGDFEFKFQPSSTIDAKGEEKLATKFPFGPLRDNDSSGSRVPPSSSHHRRFISNRDLMVSNIADVRQLHLTDASAFLVLACDGLWDVLSNEEATAFVRDFLCYTPDVCDPHIFSGVKSRPPPDVVQQVLDNCCQKLAEFAVDRGSMDNVSVMVLFFHDVVDTVARFSGRAPPSAKKGSETSYTARQPHILRGSGSSNAHPSAPSAFELTNNQLKVRNGRIVAQR